MSSANLPRLENYLYMVWNLDL